ncbi:MAG: hypothetical protein JJU13_02940 [Balneolaceae bacterium]|nr:hypothetical protein [Balneolaceae bacterium]
MTAQFRDTLKYNGKQYSIASEPLSPYLQAIGIEYPGTSTANYRGYIASWEISDKKLYLVNVTLPGFISDMDRPANLFPDQEKTFANWYTGKIRIPHGELLEYVHQGYGSLYEKELFLRILNGELVGEEEKDNRPEYEEKLAMRRRIKKDKESKKLKNRLRSLFRR